MFLDEAQLPFYFLVICQPLLSARLLIMYSFFRYLRSKCAPGGVASFHSFAVMITVFAAEWRIFWKASSFVRGRPFGFNWGDGIFLFLMSNVYYIVSLIMKSEDIIHTGLAAGWTHLPEQKMAGMLSFVSANGAYRLNVYTTTMTVTVQNTKERYDRGVTVREANAKRLKEIFDEY